MDNKDAIIKQQEETILQLHRDLARYRRSFDVSNALHRRECAKKGIEEAKANPTKPHCDLLMARCTADLEQAERDLERLSAELLKEMQQDYPTPAAAVQPVESQ